MVIRRERVSGEVKLIMVTDGSQSFGGEHTEGYTETEVSCTDEIQSNARNQCYLSENTNVMEM